MIPKKIVAAPDSFKGTLRAAEFCEIAKRVVTARFPQCVVEEIPMADGGEGTADALLCALSGSRIPCRVTDPNHRKTDAFYARLGDASALIECAAAAGLPLMGGVRNPETATTFGVGELINAARLAGARHLRLALGGSASCDGGAGAAAALGVHFLDARGEAFVPTGGTLRAIRAMDFVEAQKRFSDCRIELLCDVHTSFCASPRIFAPQKGADAAAVKRLSAGMAHFAELLERETGVAVETLAYGGAAGGFAGGFAALFGARLVSGADYVLNAVRFCERLRGADLVLTGEGKLDETSAAGKTISAVARAADRLGVPVAAFVGQNRLSRERARAMGIRYVRSISSASDSFQDSLARTQENLALDLARFMALWEKAV